MEIKDAFTSHRFKMLDKKIGIFIEDARFGGPQRMLSSLADDIKKKENIEIVFPFEKSSILKNRLKKSKIINSQIKLSWPKKNFLGIFIFIFTITFDLIKICKTIKLRKFDTIYVFGGASNFRTVISSLILKKKIIWHLHETKINLFTKFIVKFLSLKKIKFIFSSKSCKKYYLSFINPYIYKVINSGIKIKKHKKKNLYSKNKFKKIKIGIVSNINPDKNLLFFVKVAKYILKKNSNFEFFIFGKVWENQKKYYNIILSEISSEKKIKIIQNETDPDKIYKKFDIYFCSSKYESSPLSVWEAMNYKKIIFSSSVGDVPLYLKNNFNGFLFKKYNVEQVSKKLIKLTKKTYDMNKISNAAYNTAIFNFNLTKIRKKILEFIFI
jgi:glycosyltransferase involved in cell wall biosynthesis